MSLFLLLQRGVVWTSVFSSSLNSFFFLSLFSYSGHYGSCFYYRSFFPLSNFQQAMKSVFITIVNSQGIWIALSLWFSDLNPYLYCGLHWWTGVVFFFSHPEDKRASPIVPGSKSHFTSSPLIVTYYTRLSSTLMVSGEPLESGYGSCRFHQVVFFSILHQELSPAEI